MFFEPAIRYNEDRRLSNLQVQRIWRRGRFEDDDFRVIRVDLTWTIVYPPPPEVKMSSRLSAVKIFAHLRKNQQILSLFPYSDTNFPIFVIEIPRAW